MTGAAKNGCGGDTEGGRRVDAGQPSLAAAGTGGASRVEGLGV